MTVEAWQACLVALGAATTLALRLPRDYPWSTFVISATFSYCFFFSAAREPFAAPLQSSSPLAAIADIPRYAIESIGTGLDSLISTMTSAAQSVAGGPSRGPQEAITVEEVVCPDRTEVVCDGKRPDPGRLEKYMSDMSNIADMFSFMRESPELSSRLDGLLVAKPGP